MLKAYLILSELNTQLQHGTKMHLNHRLEFIFNFNKFTNLL